MSVTLPVSNVSGWLKCRVLKNIEAILVTLAVSKLSGLLKARLS
jgi:hypothetical protein